MLSSHLPSAIWEGEGPPPQHLAPGEGSPQYPLPPVGVQSQQSPPPNYKGEDKQLPKVRYTHSYYNNEQYFYSPADPEGLLVLQYRKDKYYT